MQLEKTKRLIKQLTRQSVTRISRAAMPNGFFLNNLLWYGDGLSDQAAITRGFLIEPAELESMDLLSIEDQSARLKSLLATLGEGYNAQIKYTVGNDFSDYLEKYKRDTDAIVDRYRFRWQIWSRTERHARLMDEMEKGKLRRETLAVFITKVIDSQPDFTVSESALRGYFEELSISQAKEFEQVQLDAINSRFPECRIKLMSDQEHFDYYYKFLNPSLGTRRPPQDMFDGSISILENCLQGDFHQPPKAGVSFQLDGYNHVMMVMRELPKFVGDGMIAKVLGFGFNDFEITVNVYPLQPHQVIKKLGAITNELIGEAERDHVMRFNLGEEAQMGKERLNDLNRGHMNPVNVFFAMRIWHRDADKLISHASIARNAFSGMAGTIVHHATMTETSAQLFYNTFPGWTYSTYRDWDLLTDDAVAADLLPWSASFTGKLDQAEALYTSPSGALVGLTLHIGKTGQHGLLFGVTGAGKSIFLSDLLSQILHEYDYTLIVEEGLSHGTTVQTAGADPIVISPNTGTTINYLDVNQLPLGNEHLSFAVTLCLQMLRESQGNQSRVSEIQAVLSQHLESLYDDAWEEWSHAHPEETRKIEHRAYVVHQYWQNMAGFGNTFIDAWTELREEKEQDWNEQDALNVAKFAVDPLTKRYVRNLGLATMSADDMPTHSELVENMIHTPEMPEAKKLGERLSAWNASGIYGKIFDGKTNTRLDGSITHIELGQIPEAMSELRAIAHFLMLNVAMQQVMKRPRGQKKLVIFEEGARIIAMPGGSDALKRYYTTARKFGAVVVTVLQQASALSAADPTLRSAVVDNTKLFLVSAQPSVQAAAEIAKMLGLSPQAKKTLEGYPTPDNQTADQKFGSFLMVVPDTRRKLVGTLRNYASPEVVYCGASDTEVFDKRTEVLKGYDDIVEGILIESRK